MVFLNKKNIARTQWDEKSYEHVSKTHMSKVILFDLFNIVFIALGLLLDHSKDSVWILLVIIGLELVAASVFSYLNSKKYKKIILVDEESNN